VICSAIFFAVVVDSRGHREGSVTVGTISTRIIESLIVRTQDSLQLAITVVCIYTVVNIILLGTRSVGLHNIESYQHTIWGSTVIAATLRIVALSVEFLPVLVTFAPSSSGGADIILVGGILRGKERE
jgi:uncharacterized membrane protein